MKPNKTKFMAASTALVFLFLIPGLVLSLEGDILILTATLTLWTISHSLLYQRYYLGTQAKYPLGVADPDALYFPRFNIPRPLYLDERERKRKAAMLEEAEKNRDNP